MRRPLGFTIVEVIVAAAILTVGLAGVTAMLRLAGHGTREGRQLTLAIVLAEERAEQVGAARWDSAVGDCLGLSPSPDRPPITSTCSGAEAGHVPFPDEPAGTLRTPFEQFARTVRVRACEIPESCPAASADLRLAAVAVSYPPVPGTGAPDGRPRIVTLHSLIARRH
jgi:prepilin-type N-terminal cleavage/methylation domain-containing protein